MTVIIGALVFAAIVALVAVVCIWASDTILGAFGAPANVSLIVRVIIVLVALLVILQKWLPLASSFT